jgi:hypothetical protein
LNGLTPSTNYEAQVRSICAANDTSTYSPVYSFRTTAVPDCPLPDNLTVSEITATSVRLSWSAAANHTTWDLRYQPGDGDWEYVLDLEAPSYDLSGLTKNTTYFWRVKAYCAGTENESGLASVEEFTTALSGLGSINGTLKINVFNHMLSVQNPAGAYIDRLQLYAVDGSLLQVFSVRSSDNVLIPTSITEKIAILKVVGKDTEAIFIVAVK